MNLFDLFRDVNTKEQAIEYLRGKNILHQQRVCRHGHNMALTLSDKNDRWTCGKTQCRLQVALKVGTWLEGSKVPLEKVVWLIYTWCKQYTSTKFCNQELIMSPVAITDWKNNLREVCARSLLQNPMVIGGEGLTVEIHESCFTSRKYGVNRVCLQQWVFGGICLETSECFLWAVAEPSTETLLEAVSGGVRPGSTIVSALWKSGGGSDRFPDYFTPRGVCKSQMSFVNPTTGSEVAAVFSLAKTPKRKKRPATQHRGQDSYLCEYLWRKRHENVVDLADQMYKDIASLYPLKEVVQ